MVNKEILDGNKLIAEFVSGKMIVENYHGINIIKFPNESIFDLNGLKYHSSWDWLMPVVEKIENVLNGEVSVIISEASCGINYCAIYSVSVESNTKIEAIWLACVNFIAWYNLQHNKQ